MSNFAAEIAAGVVLQQFSRFIGMDLRAQACESNCYMSVAVSQIYWLGSQVSYGQLELVCKFNVRALGNYGEHTGCFSPG